MEENSIEEYINRCNKLTETTNANWIGISNQLAINHILSDYKRVLKENEQLRTEVNSLKEKNEELLELANNKQWISPCYVTQNYIPKQKVKDKIEELNSRIEKYREYVERRIETDVEWVENVADRETVKVLQELLEK